ncbi:MAG: alpha-isopropylmalate synthase regulatory domain-containing protein [Candidatus Peribacteraceae bacterium]|nr:alpha-isopropylmalate synthase regulatory domain-containing protein [Candidatus Peribacteraceae bacterium]
MESPSTQPSATQTLIFNDTTLRDGEQAPGNTMTEQEKTVIARQLVDMGIPAIEAGFPAASPGDFRAVERIAQDIGSLTLPVASPASVHPRISGLARLEHNDIDAVLRSVRGAPHRGVHTFVSTSSEQMVKFADKLRRMGKNPESMNDFIDAVVLPGIAEELDYIRETDPETVIQFSPEDWTRSDREVSAQVILAAAQHGAHIINLPDTVGVGIPRIIHRRVADVRSMLDGFDFPHVQISWHGHNDSAQGVACAMEALYGGAEQLETTILGLGERTGNFSFEGMLAALDANWEEHERITGMKITDTLVRAQVMHTALLVAATLGIRIPREHPIVGENAFAHEAGIHQQGVIAGRRAGRINVYGNLVPERYGAKEKLILGKHSGWAGIKDYLQNNALPFREGDRAQFVARLSAAADNRRKGLSDAEVLHHVYYPTVITLTGGAYITDINRHGANGALRSVTVALRGDGNVEGRATQPDEGAVDALMQALKQCMPGVEVQSFSVRNKPGEEGASATAVAHVILKNGMEVSGEAESHDTEMAGLLAVRDAFNALWACEQYKEISGSRA